MSFEITGLDDLEREMTLLAEVAEALDGDLATLSFDPADQTSVERAIADMKLAIDQKVAGFGRSAMVDGLVAQIKQQYEEEILSRAAAARLNKEANDMTNASIDQTIFRQIENTVSDFRSLNTILSTATSKSFRASCIRKHSNRFPPRSSKAWISMRGSRPVRQPRAEWSVAPRWSGQAMRAKNLAWSFASSTGSPRIPTQRLVFPTPSTMRETN